MSIKKIYILILVFISTSCSSHMSRLSIDESFTIESIENEKIIFGGISHGRKIWNEEEKKRYSEVARNAMSRQREELTIISNKAIVKAIGENNFDKMLKSITRYKKLNDNSLRKLWSVASSNKYILFSKIISDHIHREEDKEIQEENGKNKSYKVFKTHRSTVIYAEIYDLIALKVVWSGEVDYTETKTNTRYHSHRSTILKEIVSKVIENMIYGTYPKPVPLERMIKQAFFSFAENLPHRSCKEIGFKHCVKRSASWFLSENMHGNGLDKYLALRALPDPLRRVCFDALA